MLFMGSHWAEKVCNQSCYMEINRRFQHSYQNLGKKSTFPDMAKKVIHKEIFLQRGVLRGIKIRQRGGHCRCSYAAIRFEREHSALQKQQTAVG